MTFINALLTQLRQREIRILPETIAFNLIMAMAPFLVVIVQLIAYFSIQNELITQLLDTYIQNEQIINFLIPYFSMDSHSSSGLFAIILTSLPFIWSISKGIYGISSAANITYRVPLMRFAIIERLVSFILVSSLIVLVVVILVLTFFGEHFLSMYFHLNDIAPPHYYDQIFNLAGTVASFLTYLVFFQLLFYLAPTMRIKFCDVIPGAFVTATGWSVSSLAFSIYVNRIANYSIYGSLATIVILLFWLYILGYTITLGLQVNYVLKRDFLGGVPYSPRLVFGSGAFSRLTGFDTDDKSNTA